MRPTLETVGILLLLLAGDAVADESATHIIGVLQSSKTQRATATLGNQCFHGLGLISCYLTNVYEGLMGSGFEATQVQDVWHNLYLDCSRGQRTIWSIAVLLSCCSNTKPVMVDETWKLRCSVTAKEASVDANRFGYEFRFLRNKQPGDEGVTWCPLRRTACQYDAHGELLQACYRDGTYLSAYTLSIDLGIKTNGIKSWRHIKSCSAVVQEVLTMPTVVNETIAMRQHDRTWHPATLQLLWLLVLVGVAILLIVYFSRTERCQVCNTKLLFTRELCLLCRMYGCEKPDPKLLTMLRERDVKLRGEADLHLIETEKVDCARRKTSKCSTRLRACLGPLAAVLKRKRRRNTKAVAPAGEVAIMVHDRPTGPNVVPRPPESLAQAEGDIVEIWCPEADRWVYGRVVSRQEVTPRKSQGRHAAGDDSEGGEDRVPRAVAEFKPHGHPAIHRLADSPHGFWLCHIELAPRKPASADDVESKSETRQSSAMDVFFLANHGAYGLLYEIQQSRFSLWRVAKVIYWPPPLPHVTDADGPDLQQLLKGSPYLDLLTRRARIHDSEGGVDGQVQRSSYGVLVDGRRASVKPPAEASKVAATTARRALGQGEEKLNEDRRGRKNSHITEGGHR